MASNADDDLIFEPFENQTKHSRDLSPEPPSLLSANQLLDLVCVPSILLYIFVFFGLCFKFCSC